MKPTINTELRNKVWAPTCFGSVTARDFVFRFINDSTIVPASFEFHDLDANCEVIAYAGLIAAMGGDHALLNECGFAIDFVQGACVASCTAPTTIQLLIGFLIKSLRASAIKEFFENEFNGREFTELATHLIGQLGRFPKCRRTKFSEMSKRELKERLENLGCKDDFYDETLIVMDLAPLDLIELGRYRKIRNLRIIARESLPSPDSLDWNIKFALQNWIERCETLELEQVGEINGVTDMFEFPKKIDVELLVSKLDLFCSRFWVTDEILSLVLQERLTLISIGPHDLSPSIFDEIELKCPNLVRFQVSGYNKWGTDEFVRRAEQFQENRPNVAVVFNGRYLRPENKIDYIEEPKPHAPPGPYFPFEFFCYTEDGGEIASLHLSVLTNTGWAVEFELVDDYDLNGYGIAGLLRAIIHDQKLEKKIKCIDAEGSDVKVTLNSAKAAKRLGKIASQALQDESILRKLIARTRELGLEDY